MKKQFGMLCAVALAAALAILSACNDPTMLGAELLEGDQFDVNAIDTLTILATTTRGDTLRTYSSTPSSQLRSYMFGDFQDPIFGRTTAALYIQPRMTLGTSSFIRPNFAGSTLDSIVLVLPYDVPGVYGFQKGLMEMFGMDIHELTEEIDAGKNYSSEATFPFNASPLVSHTFSPSLDSLQLITFGANTTPDTVRVRPQLRIQLPFELGQRLLNADTSVYRTDSTFFSILKGLHLRPTAVTGSMLNFLLFSELNGAAGIFVYHNQGGVTRQYQFPIGLASARVVSYRNDYTGAPVAPFIDNTELGDSLVFVQGSEGLSVRIKIPHIRTLQGIAVNKAELMIPIQAFPGDDLIRYPSASQLVLSYYDASGRQLLIRDVTNSIDRLQTFFGGVRIAGASGQPAFYRMNISTHIQRMIDGGLSDEIFLAISPRSERIERSILSGAKHSTAPMRLRVSFTRL